MPVAVPVSLQEYLETSHRPDCDYLDGELLERNVGEWDHSRLQSLLCQFLCSQEREWGILVVPEQRVQVKPDITVIAGPRPDGGIITKPPFLCIEILSPSDRFSEMQSLTRYFRFSFCTRKLPISATSSEFSARQSISLTVPNSFIIFPARPNFPRMVPSSFIL